MDGAKKYTVNIRTKYVNLKIKYLMIETSEYMKINVRIDGKMWSMKIRREDNIL